MLDKDTYSIWCAEFNPDSRSTADSFFEKDHDGDFVANEKIKFLGRDEKGEVGGMSSRVKEVKKYEFISFEHLGYIVNGVEDTESDYIKSIMPSYENYTFIKIDENKTIVKVDVESDPKYTEMFTVMWPKALNKLKEICER